MEPVFPLCVCVAIDFKQHNLIIIFLWRLMMYATWHEREVSVLLSNLSMLL